LELLMIIFELLMIIFELLMIIFEFADDCIWIDFLLSW
jgi:hypothetical protein